MRIRLCFVLGALCLRALGQAPTNDLFAGRIALEQPVELIGSTNVLATREPSEPKHRGQDPNRSLWWRWAAPSDGYVVVDTSTNFALSSRVAVYDGWKELRLLSPIALEAESGLAANLTRYEFKALKGLHYNLVLDSLDGTSGGVGFNLRLYTKPEIFVQPVGTNVTAGQPAALEVRALGKMPMTYQWQFRPNLTVPFTNLAVVTSKDRVLRFDVTAKQHEGSYRVAVTNSFGAAISAVAELTVQECVVPGVPLPPTQGVEVGRTAVMTGSAKGTEPYHFQWQYRVTDRAQFTNVVGSTEPVLTITNVSTDHAGQYRFLVSNPACSNQISTNVILAVSTNAPLVLDGSLPADLFRITNQSASFSVRVVEGYQPIRFQWFFKSSNGVTSTLPGETGPDLFLPKLAMANNGSYWATAANRYTVVTSKVARLTVEQRPPNDDFEKRTPFFAATNEISSTVVTNRVLKGGNKNATPQTGELKHQGRDPNLSVWWSFTPPVKGDLIVDLSTTDVPAAPQVLATYTGDALDVLIPQPGRTNSLTRFALVVTNGVEYSFAVENREGRYSTNITLDLTFNPKYGAPTILKEPADFMLIWPFLGDFDGAGGCRPAAITGLEAVSVDGVVRYQWQYSRTETGAYVDLPGQTNAVLTIQNVTTAHEGWYRTAIRNLGPDTTYTKPVRLVVNVGPAIVKEPESVKTNACTAAEFNVEAASCTLLSYQWRHNKQPINRANADGSNTDVLSLTDLSPADEGDYDVVIANANLVITSKVATLTLTNTPTIKVQPPDKISKRGCELLTLSVTATHNCPLNYQWFFQDKPLVGATTNVLVITNLQAGDAGPYFVRVGTPYAFVTSQVTTVTVVTNPAISKHPVGTQVRDCDIVNLSVETQPEPDCSWITYQWRWNSANLLNETNRVLSFEATAESGGDYDVVICNRWMCLTSALATVIVDARPFIKEQPPKDQRIKEGTAFTNCLSVSSCSVLAYQWQFKALGSNDFINVPKDVRHAVSTNGCLVVSNSKTNDTGAYRVVVSNAHTNTVSLETFVRVVRPPANDHFANGFSLGRTNQASASGHNEFATSEPGEPEHALQPASKSVWWSWTNPYPSLVTVNLAGSVIDTLLGVYTGNRVSELVRIAQGDDNGPSKTSLTRFMAGRGDVLHFAIDGKHGAEGTNLLLSLEALEIVSPPIITDQPLNLAARPGESVSFTVRAYGSPHVKSSWSGGGATLPHAGLPNAVITNFITDDTNYVSVLTLTNVQAFNQAVYYATLSNEYGSTNSRKVTVTLGSIVRGMVTDATKTDTNGAAIGIPGVRVSIGEVVEFTDNDGNYELVGVKQGELRADFMADKASPTCLSLNEPVQFWDLSTTTASRLLATKDGFYDYLDDQFEVGKGQTVAKRFSMSPVFTGIRFVLNWGEKPSDLDLSLCLPDSIPVPYSCIDYLEFTKGSMTEPPFALRDVDVATGWGPETITLGQVYPGTYSLYVSKFPGQGGLTLSQSGARVVAYLGGDVTSGELRRINTYGFVEVPPGGMEEWWHIANIVGTTNLLFASDIAASTNIIWINRLMSEPPGGISPTLAMATAPTEFGVSGPRAALKAQRPAGVVYSWNFGDGSPVNHDARPMHAYPEPGLYTVSLTIRELEGTNPKTSTETKTNYICVRNIPPTITITNPAHDTLFRAGDPIILKSEADGIDDGIREVEYYLLEGARRTLLGTVQTAPFTYEFANSVFDDRMYTFLALARDVHGATTWSAPVTVRVRDLRGDILIVRNFADPEIANMVEALEYGTEPFIKIPDTLSTYRMPVVKVLDQEGLRYDLVRDFSCIIWNDLGQLEGGLTDNDVRVFQAAHEAGIGLYLIGERLAESGGLLEETPGEWFDLTALEYRGQHLPGGPLVALRTQELDPVVDGFHGEVQDFALEKAFEVCAFNTNSTAAPLLRVLDGPVEHPVFTMNPGLNFPDYGDPRRAAQNFLVFGGQDLHSLSQRYTLFINTVQWLVRYRDQDDYKISFECDESYPRTVADGEHVEFRFHFSASGATPPHGVVISNLISRPLRNAKAELIMHSGLEARTNSFPLYPAGTGFVFKPGKLERDVRGYPVGEIVISGIADSCGVLTNRLTLRANLKPDYVKNPCEQVIQVGNSDCSRPAVLRVELAEGDEDLSAGMLLTVTITADCGCDYEVLYSPVFTFPPTNTVWQVLDTLRTTAGPNVFQIPISAHEGAGFYQLRGTAR